jgi:uncharacterized protein (TIGR02452 family)
MALMDRERAAQLGRETLDILRAGRYAAPSGNLVDLDQRLDACRSGTIEYPPDRQPHPPGGGNRLTRITVENDTVLAIGRRMALSGAVAALNFASAKTPGGGFLSGALAQEESIARSSGLYATLEGRQMYGYHRQRLDPFYSDYVIYSPEVPVFRLDAGDLLEEPWVCSFITCPAVHANGVRRYVPEREAEIPP